jgi:hypothetical protein
MKMTNVAEELDSPNEGLTRAHVVARIEDWKRRISTLYQNVESWLPLGVTCDTTSSVPMHEDLMKQFGVPATTVPILTVQREGKWLGKLVPQGLWIIGANGRVDLFGQKGQAIIVDRSENFSPPNWLIAPSDQRRKTISLDAATFLAALGL